VAVGADGSVVGAAAAEAAKCPAGQAWSGSECLEVVGYWEDGLARFADGTKEVKTYKNEAAEAPPTGAVDVKGDVFAGHTDSQKMGLRSVGVDARDRAFKGKPAEAKRQEARPLTNPCRSTSPARVPCSACRSTRRSLL
jgi:hypothetical protein